MAKKKIIEPVVTFHEKQKTEWKIFIGKKYYFRLMPVPYTYLKPDLKTIFK